MAILIVYFRHCITNRCAGWSQFWFDERSTCNAGWLRVTYAMAVALYALSALGWYASVSHDQGLMPVELARYLIGDKIPGTGSDGRWSLLYWFPSSTLAVGYQVALLVVSVFLALGVGGRWMALVHAVLFLGSVHRLPMLQGPGELLLSGYALYLVIDSGRLKNSLSWGLHDTVRRRTANLVIRLVQTHFLLWLMVSFASALAEPMWWNGEATWWLASAERSPMFTANGLSNAQSCVEAMTLAYLVIQAITIFSLCKFGWRTWGVISGLLFSLATAFLSGEWLYSLAIVVGLSSFLDAARQEIGDVTKA
jgi:hypothetical protein